MAIEGGRPWGFTIMGGSEFRSPLRVGKVREREGGRRERDKGIGGGGGKERLITMHGNTRLGTMLPHLG